MAQKRENNDIVLDFRNKDFSIMSEKGLPDPSFQAHPLKILSLFGGIGADLKALTNCGYNVKAIDYVEVLPYAVMAYNRIFECGPKPQDIRIWNMHPDIIVHGSPCQDWSQEGKNNINTGRSILFERVLQILDPAPANGHPELSAQPKVVIWENVPRLLWAYKDVLDYYMNVMEEFGYASHYQILKASDYNIPQDRERIFVVSILKDIPNADLFVFPDKITLKWTLKQFIDKSVNFNDPRVQLKDSEKELLFTLPDGTLAVREGTKKGYKEIEEWNIVNLAFPGSKTRRGRVGTCLKTITTGPRQAIYYNGKIRMLTAKEYMRFMGYKDIDYKKMSDAGITDEQICSLAGNSICVPVLEAIFKQLATYDIIPKPEDTFEKVNKKAKKIA